MIKIFEQFIKEAYDDKLEDVKETLLVKAIDTEDLDIVKFFVEKDYDINTNEVLFSATFNDEIFRYFLQKGAKVENLIDDHYMKRLHDKNVQKALIDYGHETFVHDVPGFNNDLRNDPKYADVIDRFERTDKYNI